jgi:hypothetical protein
LDGIDINYTGDQPNWCVLHNSDDNNSLSFVRSWAYLDDEPTSKTTPGTGDAKCISSGNHSSVVFTFVNMRGLLKRRRYFFNSVESGLLYALILIVPTVLSSVQTTSFGSSLLGNMVSLFLS